MRYFFIISLFLLNISDAYAKDPSEHALIHRNTLEKRFAEDNIAKTPLSQMRDVGYFLYLYLTKNKSYFPSEIKKIDRCYAQNLDNINEISLKTKQSSKNKKLCKVCTCNLLEISALYNCCDCQSNLSKEYGSSQDIAGEEPTQTETAKEDYSSEYYDDEDPEDSDDVDSDYDDDSGYDGYDDDSGYDGYDDDSGYDSYDDDSGYDSYDDDSGDDSYDDDSGDDSYDDDSGYDGYDDGSGYDGYDDGSGYDGYDDGLGDNDDTSSGFSGDYDSGLGNGAMMNGGAMGDDNQIDPSMDSNIVDPNQMDQSIDPTNSGTGMNTADTQLPTGDSNIVAPNATTPDTSSATQTNGVPIAQNDASTTAVNQEAPENKQNVEDAPNSQEPPYEDEDIRETAHDDKSDESSTVLEDAQYEQSISEKDSADTRDTPPKKENKSDTGKNAEHQLTQQASAKKSNAEKAPAQKIERTVIKTDNKDKELPASSDRIAQIEEVDKASVKDHSPPSQFSNAFTEDLASGSDVIFSDTQQTDPIDYNSPPTSEDF